MIIDAMHINRAGLCKATRLLPTQRDGRKNSRVYFRTVSESGNYSGSCLFRHDSRGWWAVHGLGRAAPLEMGLETASPPVFRHGPSFASLASLKLDVLLILLEPFSVFSIPSFLACPFSNL